MKEIHENINKRSAFPIMIAREGEELEIVRHCTSKELSSRLASLGLVPGASVRVANRHSAGGIVVCSGESRVALDRKLANCLMVAPVIKSSLSIMHNCDDCSNRCK